MKFLYFGHIAVVIRNSEEPHCCAETLLDVLIWGELRRTNLPSEEYGFSVTHFTFLPFQLDSTAYVENTFLFVTPRAP